MRESTDKVDPRKHTNTRKCNCFFDRDIYLILHTLRLYVCVVCKRQYVRNLVCARERNQIYREQTYASTYTCACKHAQQLRYSYEHLDMRYQYLYAQTGCIVTKAILANEEFYFKEIETIYHANAEIKFFFQLKPASVDGNMKEI